ncbi:hypothetical protein FRC06_000695 [Ceratobasidium sp. 370]|nr:hypothetical protein FRC06_000695 [Ceratobasidium sp. 370]
MVHQSDFVQDKRVVVIATLFIIKDGDAKDRFIPVFRDFLDGVHTEPGMNHFTVSVNADFTEYGIYEEYKDQDAFDKHAKSAHSVEFNKICRDRVNPIFRPDQPPAVSEYAPFRPLPAFHINRAQ